MFQFGQDYNFIVWLKLNYSFPKRQIFYSFKLIEFADDNFKFDENGRMFCKRIENTVSKGDIAPYEQFFLFSNVFSKFSPKDTVSNEIIWVTTIGLKVSFYGNPFIIKSWSQSFRRSLKFHRTCKRLMTWSIHPDH